MIQYYAFVSEVHIRTAPPRMLQEWKTLLEKDIEYFSYSMTDISSETQKRRQEIVDVMKTLVTKIDKRLNI